MDRYGQWTEAQIFERLRYLAPISSAGCSPRIAAIVEVHALRRELERRRALDEALETVPREQSHQTCE